MAQLVHPNHAIYLNNPDPAIQPKTSRILPKISIYSPMSFRFYNFSG